jgi:hypothetical protein
LKVVLDALQILGGRNRSNECASGLKHSFKAGVHFLFFDKFAPLCCREAFFDSAKEASLFVKIACNNIRCQSLGIGSGLDRYLRKLCLLLGCEVYFHDLHNMGKS